MYFIEDTLLTIDKWLCPKKVHYSNSHLISLRLTSPLKQMLCL